MSAVPIDFRPLQEQIQAEIDRSLAEELGDLLLPHLTFPPSEILRQAAIHGGFGGLEDHVTTAGTKALAAFNNPNYMNPAYPSYAGYHLESLKVKLHVPETKVVNFGWC